MWQALDYSVDILANALYCTCQICHFNSEKQLNTGMERREYTQIRAQDTKNKYCACAMNNYGTGTNLSMQKKIIYNVFFDTSILQKSMVSYMHC